MTENCPSVINNIKRWFELSDAETDAVRHHARQCFNCRRALESIEPALAALDRSAKVYDQMTYTGPMPRRPEASPAPGGFRSHVSKLGWATAVAAIVGFLVWFGSKPIVTRDLIHRPSMAGVLRIPSMPDGSRVMISMPMSPGKLGRRIPKPQTPIGPFLQRRMRMPKKPGAPDREAQKKLGVGRQYQA